MSNNKKEKVHVTIDANEASQKPKLIEVLTLHEDVEDYRIRPLDEGDIKIDDKMFERKTPSDFASSLQEGRLREQVERLAGHNERPYILVEGNMEDFNDIYSDIPPKSLRGMDASIEEKNGVGVKYCSDIDKLCDTAVRLARKSKEEVTTIQAKQTDAIKDESFIEEVFHAIDGIGINKAEKLADNFSNLQMTLKASVEEFEEIEGIGSELSKEIHETLHNDSDGPQKDNAKEEKKVYSI